MSEQLSTSAMGGLLSLNISVLPSGAATTGAVPNLGGFGALLNQQGSNGQAGTPNGGAVLPPNGFVLPQGDAAEALTDQELMQQRLLYIANMLEQQKQAGTGELPETISGELARALREYGDQRPVLPETPKPSASTDTPVVESDLPDTTVLVAETTDSVANAVSDQTAVTVPPVVETDKTQQPAGESIAAAAQVTSDTVSQAVPPVSEQSPKAVANPGVSTADEAAVPVPGMAQAKASNDVAAATTASAAPESAQRAESQATNPQRPVTVDPQSSQVVSDTQKQVQSQVQAEATRQGAFALADWDGESNKAAAEPIRREIVDNTSTSTKKVTPELSGNNEQRSVAPLPAATSQNGAQKVESMLELSQQLIAKVAGGEKVADVVQPQRVDGSYINATTEAVQGAAQPSTAQKQVSEAQNLMMPQQVKLNTAAWNNALGERAVMLAAQNSRVAEIKLDPPELGSLSVRVQVNQDQVSINFTSPHAHVRDAVEQSLPRLREMFAEQGLALQDSSVSDQSSRESGEQLADGRQGGSAGADSVEGNLTENPNQTDQKGRPISLVDYYA